MTHRKFTLLLLLVVLLALSACGSASRSASTTAGTAADPIPATLTADSSPEEVRQGVLAALERLGPVRVEATVSADLGPLTDERRAVQLLDPERHLARETVTRSRGPTEETSVIGTETLHVMGEGADAQVFRSVSLRPTDGLPLPLYNVPAELLESAQATGATRQADGSWELVLGPPATPRGSEAGAGDLENLLLVVGPDLLPVRTERTIKYTSGGGTAGPDGTTNSRQSEETSTERVEYQIAPIDGLEEQDVRLSLPAGYHVTQLSTELPVDRPRADVSWPQYWLGSAFLDLRLQRAALVVTNPDGANRSEATTSVYKASALPAWTQSIQLFSHPRQPGEPDDWERMSEPPLPGDTTEETTVAGRTATVHTRIVSTPMEAFVVQILFPDVSVQIQAYGLPPEAAKTVLAQLREM